MNGEWRRIGEGSRIGKGVVKLGWSRIGIERVESGRV